MIVDSSAIVAMIAEEPEAARFRQAIIAADAVTLSAGSWLELTAVMTRRFRGDHDKILDKLIDAMAIAIAPVTVDQAAIARDAYRRYGIGSGHPARLNFGDCFAYALAKASGRPLLFKGDDFVRTDVAVASY